MTNRAESDFLLALRLFELYIEDLQRNTLITANLRLILYVLQFLLRGQKADTPELQTALMRARIALDAFDKNPATCPILLARLTGSLDEIRSALKTTADVLDPSQIVGTRELETIRGVLRRLLKDRDIDVA